MTNPEIEVIWKSCTWQSSHRRIVRPYIEGAVDLAHKTAEHIGLEYDRPKIAKIKRCGNSYPAIGENEDATGFSIFVPVDDYRRRKVARKFSTYVRATVHELTHSARCERFGDWSLLEEVASEGLAYVAEDLALRELGDDRGACGSISDLGYCNNARVKEELVADSLESESSERALDEVMDKWFNWDLPRLDRGSTFGIIEVKRRLSEGNTFNQLLDWPPEQVLDLL